jgi:hypothetical protein
MPRPREELGEVFRRYGPAYRRTHDPQLSRSQRREIRSSRNRSISARCFSVMR